MIRKEVSMRELDVVIIDDEKLILDNLKYVLSQFPYIHIVFESQDSLAALEYAKENKDIDIIFVDITMPLLNGLDFAQQVFELNPTIGIVFVTAYEKYAINTFEVNTLDYILKPVTVSRVRKLMEKLERMWYGSLKTENAIPEKEIITNRIAASKNNQYFIIDPADACFIMQVGKNLCLYTQTDEYHLKHTVSYWEDKLVNEGWIRCHRSIIINISKIKSISPMFNSTYTVHMLGRKEEISVSRSYINEFKRRLNL